MPELGAPDYGLARFLLERGIAAVYLFAFVVALRQFPALSGERGLEPAEEFLALVPRFLDAPSLFHWTGYSDARLRIVAWAGIAMSALLLVGVPQALPLPIDLGLVLTIVAWLFLWALYQSIVNVGGTFYGFGWETLLLEAGFLAAFLGTDAVAPPWLVLVAFRWLGFRVEFGAGLIKLRCDPCWRKLTCMEYHHETQPLPNPLSWFAHHAPLAFHKLETLGNFVAQLVLPFGLFLPQPIATVAAVLMIATQLYLVVTGNYSWLNWITIVALIAGVGDSAVASLLPQLVPAAAEPAPIWFQGAAVAFALHVLVLSYWPVRNLLSSRQQMNRSFNAWHLVNTYGAFGSVTR